MSIALAMSKAAKRATPSVPYSACKKGRTKIELGAIAEMMNTGFCRAERLDRLATKLPTRNPGTYKTNAKPTKISRCFVISTVDNELNVRAGTQTKKTI